MRAMQERTCERSPQDRSVYCWVDASLAMIFRTLKRLPRTEFPSVRRAAIATDFEQPENIQTLYDGVGRHWPAYTSKKVYFILGFTISTLPEEAFFNNYSVHCNQGDVLVFSIQFIPQNCLKSPKNMEAFKATVLKNYDFPEGYKLAAAGLATSDLFLAKAAAKPHIGPYSLQGGGEHSSLRLCFNAELVSVSHSQTTFEVTTAETFRHFEAPYRELLQRYGFVVRAETNGDENVKTLAVEFVGRA